MEETHMVGPGIVVPGNHIGQESHSVIVVDQGIHRIQIFRRIDGLGLEAQMAADGKSRLVHLQPFFGQYKGEILVVPEIQETVMEGLGQQAGGFQVFFAEGKKDLFRPQWQETDLFVDHRFRENGKIQLPLDHLQFQLTGFPVHDLDPVSGEQFLDVLEIGGQEPFSVELGNSDAHLLLIRLLPVPDGLFQLLHLPEDGFSFFYIVCPGGGQFHFAPAPVEQGDPQILFQPADVLAQSGLADEQQPGTLGKTAGPGNGRYVFQVPGIHRYPLLII